MDGKLNVKVSIYQDVIGIVKLDGEFTVFVQEYDLLFKELLAYIKMGFYRFILDLDGVTYMDSSGLGIIMLLATNASKKSSVICMVCEQPQILKILSISNINKFIHFIKTSDEGISYYENREHLKEIKEPS